MEHFANQLVGTIDANPALAYAAVFLGGLISCASPCVLAIIPLVIGFIGGYAEGDTKKALSYSLVFVIGLTVSFTLLGATVGFVGGFMKLFGKWGYIAIALVAVAAGLQLLGIVNIPLPAPIQKIQPKQKGMVGGFILGFLFGLASAPCATPALIGILALASAKGNALYGATLLLFYAIGHWTLVLIAGISVGFVDKLAKARGIGHFSTWMKKLSGIIFILGGFYIFWQSI
jgi:cytochrome c biogenesis protein CcdA